MVFAGRQPRTGRPLLQDGGVSGAGGRPEERPGGAAPRREAASQSNAAMFGQGRPDTTIDRPFTVTGRRLERAGRPEERRSGAA